MSSVVEFEATTRQMRKSVKEWLTEEKATVAQALQIEAALHAGAIAGSRYGGYRHYDRVRGLIRKADVVRRQEGGEDIVPEERGCGCLLDTLERIKGHRPTAFLDKETETGKAFSLAILIQLGDTPANSKWARAAVAGIADYIHTKESV